LAEVCPLADVWQMRLFPLTYKKRIGVKIGFIIPHIGIKDEKNNEKPWKF